MAIPSPHLSGRTYPVWVSKGSTVFWVLFVVIYINYLECGVNSNSNMILYKDDTTAILYANSILELENVTKITLKQNVDWFNNMGLKQTWKTQILKFQKASE